MKKTIPSVSALAFALLLASCDDEQPVNFNLAYSVSVSIPATSGVAVEYAVESTEAATDLTTKTTEFETTPALLEKVTATDVHIQLLSPAGSTLHYFGPVKIYLIDDALGEVLIGSLSDGSESATTILSTKASGADVMSFVKQENIQAKVVFTPDGYSGMTQEVQVRMTFRAEAVKA